MYFTLKMFALPTKCASPTINPWRRHCFSGPKGDPRPSPRGCAPAPDTETQSALDTEIQTEAGATITSHNHWILTTRRVDASLMAMNSGHWAVGSWALTDRR